MKIIACAVAFALALGAAPAPASAQEKPPALKIGISTYLSGPASVFGVPARDAAELIVKDLNAKGGIQGVPVEIKFIDEGAGLETLVSEYRRLAADGYKVMFSAISSGNCGTIAPLAEDLKVLNILWDCGTQKIFETNNYKYVYRTQANATPEVLAPALYLLKNKPDFKTIAVVNQDYAYGRESWQIFLTALKAMKPDVKVVGEFFPKFGSPDYSTEISRLLALRPDVIFSTAWGGDLDTFIRQASQRGLMNISTFLLPVAESSLERVGPALPPGHFVGARGDHYFLHPERAKDPQMLAFVEAFRAKSGSYPIYPVFHMIQAFAGLQAAYDKAVAAKGAGWPTVEEVAAAMRGLTFSGLGRDITIREDNQAIEAQLMGTTARSPDYKFPILTNIMIFEGADITTPVGRESVEWVGTLKPDFVQKARVTTFK